MQPEVLGIAVMLVAAPVAFVANARVARVVALVAAAAEVVIAVGILVAVSRSGTLSHALGGWGAPLGIDLRVDGIAAVMIALTAFVGTGVTLYAAGYFGDDERYRHYWPLWLFLWGSLIALFSSNDAFNLYVCLELVTMSAVGLIVVGAQGSALFAAIRYMLAAIAGSLFYLLGVAMLYGATGVLDLTALGQVATYGTAAGTGLALMLVGLVTKTALVPMHFWLPSAHANAPSPVSAALSALVVKGSFFIALRMVTILGGDMDPGLPVMLGVLGSAAIVWGSVQAFRQTRLKLLVAYSTVAQVGYLFIVFPLAYAADGAYAGMAVAGAVFHALSHGLAKCAMFLAAGSLLVRLGHDRLDGMAGLARTAPSLSLAFAFAGVSMVGLPPSGGFVPKWLYVTAAIRSGEWWWALPVLAGGLLAGAYVFRVTMVFLRAEPDPLPEESGLEHASGRWSSAIPLAISVVSLLLGLAADPILRLLGAYQGVL